MATLTATESMPSPFADTANSITVSGVTSTILWISSGNFAHLTVAPPAGGTLPRKEDIKYDMALAGGGAVGSGDFNGDPYVMPPGDLYFVRVGVDKNCDGIFDAASEMTLSFKIRLVDLSGATIKTARTLPADLAESLYEINAGEIYDTASTFQIVMTGGLYGPNTVIRAAIFYSGAQLGGGGGIVQSSGTTVDWTPYGDSDAALIKFYADANNSGTWEMSEAFIDTTGFKVKPLNALAFTFDLSNQITDFQTMTISDRRQAVQDAVDGGVKLLRVKNSQSDFRAAVTITVSAKNSPNEIFQAGSLPAGYTGPLLPDAIKTVAESDRHFINMDNYNIRFVSDYVGKRGAAKENNIIVDWNDMFPDTIVHEIGHTLGLSHSGTTMHIMRDGADRSNSANLLSENDANKFSGL